jgi:hypothetical protein
VGKDAMIELACESCGPGIWVRAPGRGSLLNTYKCMGSITGSI